MNLKNCKGEEMLEQIFGVIIGNAALIIPLFLWVRFESRADIRHMDTELESNRELIRAIHDEVKDFHVILCEIQTCKKNEL